MTYPLTPRADRLRVLRARRDQLDALIRRLEDAEQQDGDGPYSRAIPDCGTDSGYSRHRRNGEDPCDPCKTARRDAERLRYIQRKAKRLARLSEAS